MPGRPRSCSATPSAASSSARPTKPSRARSRWRSIPACCRSSASARATPSASATRPIRSSAARSTPASLGCPIERLADVVIAYEPIWAIGTGKTASADQADDACGFIRSLVGARDQGAGERVRIQYGGSVKPANAAELLGRTEIDGALVGGAALDPDDFAAIVAAA